MIPKYFTELMGPSSKTKLKAGHIDKNVKVSLHVITNNIIVKVMHFLYIEGIDIR